MKQYKMRVFFLIGVMWSTVISYSAFDFLKEQNMKNTLDAKALLLVLGIHVFVLIFLGSGLIWFKSQSRLNWREFLRSDIDVLDEDERARQLDADIKRRCSNIIVGVVLCCVGFFSMNFAERMFSLPQVLILAAIIFTSYHLMNLAGLKYAYDTDKTPRFLNRYITITLLVAVVTLSSYYAINHLFYSKGKVQNSPVSLIIKVEIDNTSSYTIPIAGYRSPDNNDVIIIDEKSYRDFLRADAGVDEADRSYLVYEGSIDDYEKERDTALFDEGKSLVQFYDKLMQYTKQYTNEDKQLIILQKK